jgi:hypothetical protein
MVFKLPMIDTNVDLPDVEDDDSRQAKITGMTIQGV